MSDLMSSVDAARQSLNALLTRLQVDSARYVKPGERKVYGSWIRKAQLYKDLEQTGTLFAYRDLAFSNLCALRDLALNRGSETLSSLVEYGQVKTPMSVARVLALESYLAITWSIYDRITNVAGRMMGDECVTNNPLAVQNPKIVEHLLSAKKCCFTGFGANELLFNLYAETIFFSYTLRNVYMHDGGIIESIPVLAGQSMGECFCISQEVADLINETIHKRANIPLASVCNVYVDLVRQLEDCHLQLDQMFVGLLGFTCEAFCCQVSCFKC